MTRAPDPNDVCRWQRGGWHIDGRPPGHHSRRGGLACDAPGYASQEHVGRPSGPSHTVWCSRPGQQRSGSEGARNEERCAAAGRLGACVGRRWRGGRAAEAPR